jgi:hypothetical protein
MHSATRWFGAARGITEQQRCAAGAVVSEAGGESTFDLVVLSGSMVANLGHGNSDVDLYVIRSDGSTPADRAQAIDGVSVQFNHVRMQDLETLAQTFDSFRVGPDERGQLLALRPWAKLANRLSHGEVLLATDPCRRLLGECDANVLRLLVLTESSRMVGRLAEDAAGGLLTGDALIGLFAAREALRHAAEAVLAACGDVFVGDSFLWRRLARAPVLSDVVTVLWGLYTQGPPWGAESDVVAEQVRTMVDVSTYLASYAQLDGWSSVMTTCCPWPYPRRDGLRRNPFFQVLRFGDTFALIGPDKAYRSNEATARAWLRADAADSDMPATNVERFQEMGLLVPYDGVGWEGR